MFSSFLVLSLSMVVDPLVSQTWCQESESCAGTTVEDELIYCWGYLACAKSTITGGLCDCAGFGGCFASTSDLSDDQFCESEDACALAEISTDGTIYCGGYYACAGATMSSTELIECPGEAACRYGEIEESTDGVYCFGDYGCWYTSIGGTSSISSFGYRSTYFADIDSTGESELDITFGGYYAAYQASVYCADESTCKINCQQSTSCYDLTVFCYGNCEIDCDDSYSCPTVYYFTSSDSDTTSTDTDTSTDDSTSSGTSSGTSGNSDNMDMSSIWESEYNERRELRNKHKKEFTVLMKTIHNENKHIKDEKLNKFNEIVESEFKEWSKKYNKKFHLPLPTNDYKNEKVLNIIGSSDASNNSLFSQIADNSMVFYIVSFVAIASILINVYYYYFYTNNKGDHYQSLA